MIGLETETQATPRVLLHDFDAASELATTPRRVRRWAKAGLIPYVALPDGDIRFRIEDLRAFAESMLIPTKDPAK